MRTLDYSLVDMSGRNQAEQIVQDVVAYSNGDASKRDALSETVYVYNPGLPDGEAHSRAEWEEYQSEIEAGFPDFHLEVHDRIAQADVVMEEVEITGTHEGEFKGLPPTGREVEIWAMSKFLIEDGQVEEWYTYYDTSELQDQLGLSFPEIIGQLPKLVWGKIRPGA